MKTNNKKKLNLFLGNCVYAAHGERISLPMDEAELKTKLNQIEKKYGELIISDYEKIDNRISALHIGEHSDIFELNYVLSKPMEFIALYINGDEDLEFAKSMWRSGKYLYFPGVNNLEELGEAIARKGLIKGITESLIDTGYIDFEQIGQDFECNGIRLYKGLGAIGQISDRDFNKWSKLIKKERPSFREFLIQKGIEVSDIDNHESDLYVKASELSDMAIAEYEDLVGFKITRDIFVCSVTKVRWYDIPFGYMPEHYNN